jgi:hypothetical protein
VTSEISEIGKIQRGDPGVIIAACMI